MTEIRSIRAADVFADPRAASLLAEYAAECSIPVLGPINPQPAVYEALERGGFTAVFGVYDEGRMVGFATLLMAILPHYGVKTGTVESLFVAAEARDGGAGADLLKAIESHAKASGCTAILYSAPSGSQFERLLRARRDCTQTNTVFARPLYD